MSKDYPRARRLEAELLRTLAELIRREVKDPRVGLVTLTAVALSRDFAHATVYFLPFDAQRNAADVGRALNSAAGFLRRELRSRVKFHHVPELVFVADESIERLAKLSSLIATAVASDRARESREEPEDGSGGPAAGP